MTAYALWAYGLGFLGFSLVKVLVPGFYARHEMKRPVRYAVASLLVGMAISLALFGLNRVRPFPAPHVVLAASTSITACLNAALLFRRLRREKVFAAEPGWGLFLLQVGGALTVMIALVVLYSGPLAVWLSLDDWHRVARLAVVILGAIAVYFAALFALGLRYRHLFHRP
ncbi:MAG TPA: lipid II flippase MurJ, partial [Steroidobacteraceae bacterium]|nr:lipid II flippase MurJ [Steroidobacteraceae bacterium]